MASNWQMYWNQYWSKNDHGWIQDGVVPQLSDHLEKLTCGRKGVRIFVPLCGVAKDMKWLYDIGHTIIGVEGIETAVKKFFSQHHLLYQKEQLGNINGVVYKTTDNRIQLFCCDFFHTDTDLLGQIDAVWDRGALVALDKEERGRYGRLMESILKTDFRYLLSTFEYDETKWKGDRTPKHTPKTVVEDVFGHFCNIQQVGFMDSSSFEEVCKECGVDYFHEYIWLLSPKKHSD